MREEKIKNIQSRMVEFRDKRAGERPENSRSPQKRSAPQGELIQIRLEQRSPNSSLEEQQLLQIAQQQPGGKKQEHRKYTASSSNSMPQQQPEFVDQDLRDKFGRITPIESHTPDDTQKEFAFQDASSLVQKFRLAGQDDSPYNLDSQKNSEKRFFISDALARPPKSPFDLKDEVSESERAREREKEGGRGR